MKKIISFLFVFSFFWQVMIGQMWNGVDTLYGNEWIEYDQPHFKFLIAKDSIYRISYQTLLENGFPINDISANQIRLYSEGNEQPIFISESEEFIEFYGRKNTGTLDEYLFKNPELEMANPDYSMFTDSSAYFLTWYSTPSEVRIENISNNLNIAEAPESFCFYTESLVFSEAWTKKRFSGNIYHSNFDVAEGFAGNRSLSQSVNIFAEDIFPNIPTSQLDIRVVVTNHTSLNNTHEQRVSFNGELLSEDNFIDAKVLQHNFEVPTSTLQTNNVILFEGLFNNQDRQRIAFCKLTYPRSFSFENKNFIRFSLPQANSPQYLEINEFDVTETPPILYDLTNKLRIETQVSNGQVQVVLPSSSTERELILFNPTSAIESLDKVKEVNFEDYRQDDAEFIIISNNKLFDDGQGNNWVQEYANHRQSSTVNSYETKVVDIQQLYDQFAYGVNRHSISIRNFAHFINKNWDTPKYIFLIGKARTYDELRTTQQLEESLISNKFHVPTFGTKGGGDNLLLATNTTDYPIFSIGRLAAKTPQDVKIYLDKIIAQESIAELPQTIEDKGWRKNIVHLGGGDAQEQIRFKSYLDGFKTIIEDSHFGANTFSFFKTTSDPVQISVSDQLVNLINEGVSIMTLFGHASPTGFDFSIDKAETYENEGRFPVMISLGCYSGQIHADFDGVSEEFVLTESKGAIAFFASTGLSLENQLRRFGNEFYDQLGNQSYGEGIGDIARKSLKNINNSIGYLAGIMTLHGDPSIKVAVGEGPDFVINPKSLIFEPNPISIQRDSFDLTFEIVNIGQKKEDKILIEIIQEFPNGTQHNVVVDSIQTPVFKETFSYKIPTLGSQTIGLNKFFVEIDKGNQVAELPNPMAENNNVLIDISGETGVSAFFVSNEVLPVYPKEFSIVSNPNVTLKASTMSPFLPEQNYVFQLDTTNNFNSPFLQTTEVTQTGGVIKWKPNVPFQNERVYYWRISPEENPNLGGFIWRSSSFLYKSGVGKGWNQSHQFQFEQNSYSNIEQLDNVFEYIKDFKDLQVQNRVAELPFILARYFLNGERQGVYFGNPDGAVGIAVFDSLSIEPWVNTTGNLYGATTYWPNNLKMFPFRIETSEQREKVINMLENVIPDGNYVLFMTLQDKGFGYFPELWSSDTLTLGNSIFDVLEEQGAMQVRELENIGALPYAFLYKKGEGAMMEQTAEDIEGIVDFTVPIPGNWDSGYIESLKIGPSSNWESLQWQASSLDNPATDEFHIEVIGVDESGRDTTLIENVTTTDTSLTQISAVDFPYLKLRFHTQDSIQKTTAQLDYWRVFYKGLPDAAINPSANFVFQNDTLRQGEALSMSVAIENVNDTNFDSLLVKFSIADLNNNIIETSKRFKPLVNGDTLIANFTYNTHDLQNKNSFKIQINPNEDQKESFLFNNVGVYDFFVETDQRNPLLDVTFNGVHIMDGDLISSQPEVLISLKDDNPFLLLDDPSSVKIFLKSPHEPELRQIFVDGDTLIFIPPGGSENKAQFIYEPKLKVDGTYYLVIQAEDATGNQSGDLDYKISFEVKNQSSITNVLNYPNPFSTSTRFVFTLTGSELPEDMKIQIMTISGKIVREIRYEELGPLHIGNNITTYAWDGTDDFGQKLANGVYLYRIISKKFSGEKFEHLQTKADQFFKNGFGKMVILR